MIAVWFALGVAALVGGAEFLVRGASRLAVRAGISPLVIGLTVVAMGTSAPELAVSLGAARDGFADISVGNVVGSNIANILLVLGLCAMISTITVAQQLIRWDIPILIGASLLMYLFGWDGSYGILEGFLFLGMFGAYTTFAIVQSRREGSPVQAEYEEEFDVDVEKKPWWLDVVYLIIGLAGLVVGADWLVESAVAVAKIFGISELVIGLTVVAVGTSLPEVATSVVAAFKGEQDIAVGNAVGSNIANIVLVLGATTFFAPGGIPVAQSALQFDIPVMIAVAVACLPIFFTGYKLARWEGAVFLLYYIAYILYLALSSVDSGYAEQIETCMLFFVIPLTLLTFTVLFVRYVNKRRKASHQPV